MAKIEEPGGDNFELWDLPDKFYVVEVFLDLIFLMRANTTGWLVVSGHSMRDQSLKETKSAFAWRSKGVTLH